MFHDFSRKKVFTAIFIALFLSASLFLTKIITSKLIEAKLAFNAFQYEVSFAQANNKNLAASILSSIQNDNSTSQFNQNKAQSIPVLLYHGIISEPDGSNVLLENFKDQMFVLKKAGWQTITIEDFYAFMRGEKQLPDKSFLLTFDDGRKDSYYPVDPILRALDYRAVIYVITSHSFSEDPALQKHRFYLNKGELQRMHENGRWDIQAHTHSGHDTYKITASGEEGRFYSNKLWLEDKHRIETDEEFIGRVTYDLITAKTNLEHNLGVKSIAFAYPFGDFGQDSINFPEAESIVPTIVKSIYPVSFYQVWPGGGFSSNYPGEDIPLAKRISIGPNWSGSDVLGVLERGQSKDLPYQDNFEKYNGWIKTWGRITFGDSAIRIGSYPGTIGSLVFLDGSNLWENYVVKSRVDLVKGQTFSLLARYKNDNNYVACVFTPGSIRIEQMVDGGKKVTREQKENFRPIDKNREVGIGVHGEDVDCYADGKIAISGYNISGIAERGGIGFETWDPEVNNSEMIIKEVSVEEIK